MLGQIGGHASFAPHVCFVLGCSCPSSMVSDASKKKALAKKAKQNIKLHGSAGSSPAVSRNAVRLQRPLSDML
jgi:hypothetical protein